ncbi:MAG: hypothetical protein ACI80S_001279 [Pseudohongiellaceae bacterium]|jgi:hypothetical protein
MFLNNFTGDPMRMRDELRLSGAIPLGERSELQVAIQAIAGHT